MRPGADTKLHHKVDAKCGAIGANIINWAANNFSYSALYLTNSLEDFCKVFILY